MILPYLCLLLMFWLLDSSSDAAFGRQKKYSLLKLESCAEYPDLPIKVSGLKNYNFGRNNRSVHFTANFKNDVDPDMSGAVSVWKCDTSGTPDSCEYFVNDLRVPHLCKKMIEKNQAWSNFVESFQPKLNCPIKKGQYNVTYQLIDSTLRFFPVPVGLWKIRGQIVENGKMSLCLDVHHKVFELRT